jgi:hypothetical protein
VQTKIEELEAQLAEQDRELARLAELAESTPPCPIPAEVLRRIDEATEPPQQHAASTVMPTYFIRA